MVSKCFGCYKEPHKLITPSIFSYAVEEESVDKYCCDVVAYLNNGNTVVIEVYHTHEVDDDKSTIIGMRDKE